MKHIFALLFLFALLSFAAAAQGDYPPHEPCPPVLPFLTTVVHGVNSTGCTSDEVAFMQWWYGLFVTCGTSTRAQQTLLSYTTSNFVVVSEQPGTILNNTEFVQDNCINIVASGVLVPVSSTFDSIVCYDYPPTNPGPGVASPYVRRAYIQAFPSYNILFSPTTLKACPPGTAITFYDSDIWEWNFDPRVGHNVFSYVRLNDNDVPLYDAWASCQG